MCIKPNMGLVCILLFVNLAISCKSKKTSTTDCQEATTTDWVVDSEGVASRCYYEKRQVLRCHAGYKAEVTSGKKGVRCKDHSGNYSMEYDQLVADSIASPPWIVPLTKIGCFSSFR